MINYNIKINNKIIQSIEARRLHARNDDMEENGYIYHVVVWNYEEVTLKKFDVTHKYKDGFGKLLEIINSNIPK